MSSFFSQSITDVFGGRSRDRGSSGNWAVQDIGSAVESEGRGWCFLGLKRRRVLPQLRASIPRCCAIMSPCRCGLPRAAGEISCKLWRTLPLAVPTLAVRFGSAAPDGPCMPHRPITDALTLFFFGIRGLNDKRPLFSLAKVKRKQLCPSFSRCWVWTAPCTGFLD